MSAFLLAPDDLAAIARALSFAHDGDDAVAEVWFNTLLDENLKSVGYRYPDAARISDWFEEGEALFTWANIPTEVITAEQLDELLRSYQYQSCEHPGWEESTARKATDVLRRVIAPAIVAEKNAAAAVIAERRAALAKLPTLYPKETAKVIRKILKAAFPATAFSVKTARGSMVSSVDIRWTDGPTAALVDALVGCFEAGTFDGMTDSYTYDSDTLLDVEGTKYRPGCRYVRTTRELSPTLARRCAEQVATYYGAPVPVIIEYVSQWTKEICWKLEHDTRIADEYASTLIHRAASDASRYTHRSA